MLPMKKRLLLLLPLILLIAFHTVAQAQTSVKKTKRNVAILIFDGVQMIDYTGPYEAFGGVMGGEGQFNVYTVAEKPGAIKTNSGMSISPQYSFEDVPSSDIVVIPGGMTRGVLNSPTALKWIQQEAQSAEITMSVCTGAFILAKAGLLDGLEATTTAGHTEGLKKWAPKAKVINDKRFVDAGKIVTTAGGTSSIDGALHVIERVFGKGAAQMSALMMEYDWEPEPKWVRSTLADKYMQFVYSVKHVDGGWKTLSREGTSDGWENKWDVTTDTSATAILDSVNDTIANGKTYGEAPVKWVRLNRKTAKNVTQSMWQFADEKGKAWNGVVNVEPVKGAQNRFTLSVKVARTNASARLSSK
jgi:putative intracellular protease/amidase